MADKNFLKYLGQFQRDYRPVERKIEHTLELMEDALHNLGYWLNSPITPTLLVKTYLMKIARIAFDALNADNYADLFEAIIVLHTRKNSGYAGIGATDPWANFRTAEWFGCSAYQGCLVRMGDKFIRVKNLSKNPEADQVGEAITDTLQDLAVYCLVAMCLLDEEVSGVRNVSLAAGAIITT